MKNMEHTHLTCLWFVGRIYLYELILYAAYAVMIDHIPWWIFSVWCFFQRRIERLGGMLARRFATRHATTLL